MYFEDLNFLNLPAVRFKKPNAKNLDSFYADIFKKFSIDEDNGIKWKDEAYEALIKDDKEAIARLEREGGKIIFVDDAIDVLIDNYMLEGGLSEEAANSHKSTILKGGYIKDIEFKHSPEQIVFTTKFGTFKASKLSEVFPVFKQFPGIETRDRHSKCHAASIDVSSVLMDKHKVATGYVYMFGEGAKYLHTWIEVKFDGRDFVIDTTRNLFTPKKFYYYIRNIEGPVYKISPKTIEKEGHILEYLTHHNDWLSKLYLSNRHQALQVYKILKAEEEREKMKDPLYQAAKHFRESMIAADKRDKGSKKKSKTEPSQMQ